MQDLGNVCGDGSDNLRIAHRLIEGLREIDSVGTEVILQQEMKPLSGMKQMAC